MEMQVSLKKSAYAAALWACAASAHAAITPPSSAPNASTPGGSVYDSVTYNGVINSTICQPVGSNPCAASGGLAQEQYWVFEPQLRTPGNFPTGKSLPVVLFMHGYSVTTPDDYQAWINHLVLRGYVVVYPAFQEQTLSTKTETFTKNAAVAVDAARRWLTTRTLNSANPIIGDTTQVAIGGHSIGGVISASLAAYASGATTTPAAPTNTTPIPAGIVIPLPKVIFAVAPGRAYGNQTTNTKMPLYDLSKLGLAPLADPLLVTLAYDEDSTNGTCDAHAFWHLASNVDPANKNYVIVHDDTHGSPITNQLHPRHSAGVANVSGMYAPDVFDWYGTFKILDGLADYALKGDGTALSYGLGTPPTVTYNPNSPSYPVTNQDYMGLWSDGVPVNYIEVVNLQTGVNLPASGYPLGNGTLPYTGCDQAHAYE